MKKLLFTLSIFAIFSCKKEEKKESLYPEKEQSQETRQLELGQEIFNGKGMCYSCHKPEAKIIGPSIIEIAKIYKEQNADIKLFLKEKSGPIVDPKQYPIMKTNFSITKTFSEEELKAVEAYMYSFMEKTP